MLPRTASIRSTQLRLSGRRKAERATAFVSVAELPRANVCVQERILRSFCAPPNAIGAVHFRGDDASKL